jgi:fluoroquinolone transport system permease protein
MFRPLNLPFFRISFIGTSTMKQFFHLLRHDFMLLQRNNVIAISVVVTAVYVGVFQALTAFGSVEKWLVLVIFNDPALLGFLFVGVMALFERNENTTQALAVSPMRISAYIFSKTAALTAIAIVCCFGMAFAAYGMNFRYGHFAAASALTTALFSFIGFIVVAGQRSFNTYLLRAVSVVLVLSAPFLGYFDLVPAFWFTLFPTQPAIALYNIAFAPEWTPFDLAFAYCGLMAWCVVSFVLARRLFARHFQ